MGDAAPVMGSAFGMMQMPATERAKQLAPTNYGYDAAGLLTSANDPAGTATWSYDDAEEPF